jgi:hypothetical protein
VKFDQGPKSEDQTYLRITGSPFCCCCAIVRVCLGEMAQSAEVLGEVLACCWAGGSAFAEVRWCAGGQDTAK